MLEGCLWFASAALAYIVGRPQREMNGWVICQDEAKALVSRDLSGAADDAVPALDGFYTATAALPGCYA